MKFLIYICAIMAICLMALTNPVYGQSQLSKQEQNDLTIELEFWDSIKNSNNQAELQAYITRFPNGEFVTIAKARLKALSTNSNNSTNTANTTTHNNRNRAVNEQKRIDSAVVILNELMDPADRNNPIDLAKKAECIMVIPSVVKFAVGIGGQAGKGVCSCRKDGGWTAPVFFELGGGSVGPQVGGSSSDLVLLIMNKDGIDNLLLDKFTLGVDAAVAAGFAGRNVKASTDANMVAGIVAYSKSKGFFAGAALDGSVIKPDKGANHSFYHRDITAKEILIENKISVPSEAQEFIESLESIR